MIAAQYEIPLPADYDMQIIYRRVAERGSVFDHRAGLGLKAFLVRDIADGAPANAYAPFYLWNDPNAFATFHWKDTGFSSILKDFGRPSVRTWIGGGFERGSAIGDYPTHAIQRIVQLASGSDPRDETASLINLALQFASRPETHSVAWAINPTSWNAVIFRLLTMPVPAKESDVLARVCHFSAPEMFDL